MVAPGPRPAWTSRRCPCRCTGDPRSLVPHPMADEPTPIAQFRGPDRRHVGRHGRVRPYRPSGLYRQASPAPELQQAMDHLRAQLLTDKGGPDAVTTAERVLIDLAVAAAIKSQRVEAYLATLPCLIDKRRRRVWQVVRDSTTLATHLATLLRDLGLERRARSLDLMAEITRLQAAARPAPGEPAPAAQVVEADADS